MKVLEVTIRIKLNRALAVDTDRDMAFNQSPYHRLLTISFSFGSSIEGKVQLWAIENDLLEDEAMIKYRSPANTNKSSSIYTPLSISDM